MWLSGLEKRWQITSSKVGSAGVLLCPSGGRATVCMFPEVSKTLPGVCRLILKNSGKESKDFMILDANFWAALNSNGTPSELANSAINLSALKFSSVSPSPSSCPPEGYNMASLLLCYPIPLKNISATPGIPSHLLKPGLSQPLAWHFAHATPMQIALDGR